MCMLKLTHTLITVIILIKGGSMSERFQTYDGKYDAKFYLSDESTGVSYNSTMKKPNLSKKEVGISEQIENETKIITAESFFKNCEYVNQEFKKNGTKYYSYSASSNTPISENDKSLWRNILKANDSTKIVFEVLNVVLKSEGGVNSRTPSAGETGNSVIASVKSSLTGRPGIKDRKSVV